MQSIELYSSAYITVCYEPDSGLIAHVIHQPIGIEQETIFREALNSGTRAMQRYGISKWLSDDRKNGPLTAANVQWAHDDWTPRTIRAGWTYWANIVPETVHAAGSMMPLIEDLYTRGLTMRVFTTVDDGRAWLASVG